MFSKLLALWKSSPKVRFIARTAAVAAAGYVVSAVKSGEVFTFSSLVYGAATAAITATVGYLGLEPFVGVKTTGVKVPHEAVKASAPTK